MNGLFWDIRSRARILLLVSVFGEIRNEREEITRKETERDEK